MICFTDVCLLKSLLLEASGKDIFYVGISIHFFHCVHMKKIFSVSVWTLVCVKYPLHDYVCVCHTTDGRMYSWGDNQHGQLGLGDHEHKTVNTPTEISCLYGLTPYQIAAGGYHSFMLTTSGALFGWGKNRFVSCRKWLNINCMAVLRCYIFSVMVDWFLKFVEVIAEITDSLFLSMLICHIRLSR